MADPFLALSAIDRAEILQVAADASGRPTHLLEKDVWVVWALSAMFESSLGEHLVFKGGTSLSKVYNAIRRFSEDVDLTYDIRRLVPDLVGETGDAIPGSRSEERRWSTEVRRRLPVWVSDQIAPVLETRLAKDGAAASIRIEGDKVFIDYDPIAAGTGYVAPSVMLEFGARSTGEPNARHEIVCDAAEHVGVVSFPTATPRVMRAERTFWEKATAIHVFCAQGRLRGERFARHWHDLARLDDAGFAQTAVADRQLALAVARHKGMFFPEKAADRTTIDYTAAVGGELRLVPEGAAFQALEEDYGRMVEDGLLLDDAEPFAELMTRCADIANRANVAAGQG